MKVQVISPWYPEPAAPFDGIFVKQQVDALGAAGTVVSVEVPRLFPAPRGPIPQQVRDAMRTLAAHDPTAMFCHTDEVVNIPCPVPAGAGYLGRIESFAEHLGAKRQVLPIEADVVHAHLGVPTAAAALRVDPSTPLVVTEHQSTLDRVFADEEVRAAYIATIERSAQFLCVSEQLRQQIAGHVGSWALDQIRVVPNVVAVDHIAFLERPEVALRHWVSVGSLAANKGTRELLAAFAHYRENVDAHASLTLVGGGSLTEWVRRFLADQHLTSAVRLVGPVPHDAVGSHLAEADVFVHLSPYETFGIASLEAIAAGLPVVSLRNGGADHAWGHIEASVGMFVADSQPATVAAGLAGLRDRSDQLDLVAGREMVEQRYAAGAVAQTLLDVYRQAIDR